MSSLQGEFTIFCGLSDCLALLENFHYSDSDISYLRSVLPATVEDEFYTFLRNLSPSDIEVYALPEGKRKGALSTEHNSSELRVIETNAHRVDSYFLHLTMQT